jgi:hypothetical protein
MRQQRNSYSHGKTTMTSIRSIVGALRIVALALFVGVIGIGCDVNDLLEVDPVDRIPADGFTAPINAELLVSGAIADFECAYASYVTLTGIVSDEFTDATQTAARWPADRRDFSRPDYQDQYGEWDCTGPGAYVPLSIARWSADNILTALQGWTDAQLDEVGADRGELLATAAAYSGYSYTLLGEGFCSMAIDVSEEMTPTEIFQIAVDRFTTAIEAARAAGESDMEYMALVGRARAYLNLGNTSAALADAQQVPEGFYSAASMSGEFSRTANRVFAFNGPDPLGGDAVSVEEPYRDYQHFGEPDPRISVSDFVQTNSDGTDVYHQQKYGSLDEAIPLATYDEAQLIIAEIQGGATAVGIINDFHADAGLGTFSSTDEAEILDHLIEERRVELWLEGHRFNDIERFGLPLVPAPGTPYRKGLDYGDARCFPLPDIEIRNNPNI